MLVGASIDFWDIFASIPIFVWVLSSLGLMSACYFFYIKYKINQDTFGEF